ncbi:hypothetical protein AB6D24_23750, partial [Vibrio splendidus]
MPNYHIDTHPIFEKRTLEKFEDFALLLLDSRASNHEKSTLRSDKARINKLCEIFGLLPIADIKHSELVIWLMNMEGKYKPKTTVEYLNLLKAVFRLAVYEKVITESPAESLHVDVEPTSEPAPFYRLELETMSLTPTEFISDHNLVMCAPM